MISIVEKDWTDHHIEGWQPVLPDLDPDIEAVVTRIKKVGDHLRKVRAQSLVDFNLQRHEFDTMHALAGQHGSAAPSELAEILDIAPASVTGRVDGLVQRGYVDRVPSAKDRRRVDITLTEEGWAAWRGAMDVLGDEETRLLMTLSATERRALSDYLRRIALAAEAGT